MGDSLSGRQLWHNGNDNIDSGSYIGLESIYWNGFDLTESSHTKPELLKNEKKCNKKLKGGDILVVWWSDLCLDHVATLIDDGVYCERVDLWTEFLLDSLPGKD